MVKRLISVCIVLVLVFLFTIPSFAVDTILTDSNIFGFSFDNSRIFMFNGNLPGNLLNVDNQTFSVNRFYLYIPAFAPCNSLTCNFSLCLLSGALVASACDYGIISDNSYTVSASLPLVDYSWIGSSQSVGSSNFLVSCQVSFSDLPFDSFDSKRYIRYTVDARQNFNPLTFVCWMNRSVNNPSYTFSGVEASAAGRTTSGQLVSSGYYITGRLTNVGNLTSNTSGTGGYLYVPSHTILANASNSLSFTVDPHSVSGSIVPASGSDSSIDRTYLNTVSATVVRSFDDSDLIDAVNDASDRNHADLGRIEDQMQEVVDHMQGLEQQGNEINGTTSQSTINNATGVVNTGTSSMSDTANYVSSGVTSGSAESQGYVQLLGYGVGEIVNFGSQSTPLGVWIWAIIFIPVAFFIFRRISE